MTGSVPDLAEIRATAAQLEGRIARTPVLNWRSTELLARLAPGTSVNLKLELFQHTGSFKARGALAVMLGLAPDALARGVTAVSAGNHAIATAWAARELGTHAKVVMLASANPARVARVRSYGAELVVVADVAEAFAIAERIGREEGRAFVHPFEGPLTARGTGTVGLEWLEQSPDLDAVLVPVGGGGLLAGIACAVKQLRPNCVVIGVEPSGADSMWRSFTAGSPQRLERVATIADSLGAPYALPYSFGLCRRFTDEIVRIEDAAMVDAMRLAFATLKLILEPAGAAATAALLGPLRDRLAGRRVGVLVCGSNIDLGTFKRLVDS
jgi:threonine dehydratase